MQLDKVKISFSFIIRCTNQLFYWGQQWATKKEVFCLVAHWRRLNCVVSLKAFNNVKLWAPNLSSNAGQKSAECQFLSKLVYKFCPSQKLVHLSGCFKHSGWSTSQKKVQNPLNPRKLFLAASCTFFVPSKNSIKNLSFFAFKHHIWGGQLPKNRCEIL